MIRNTLEKVFFWPVCKFVEGNLCFPRNFAEGNSRVYPEVVKKCKKVEKFQSMGGFGSSPSVVTDPFSILTLQNTI